MNIVPSFREHFTILRGVIIIGIRAITIILHSSDIFMYPVNYVMNWSDIAVVQKTREPSAAFNMKKYCYTIILIFSL